MERGNEESMLIKLASVDSIDMSFFCDRKYSIPIRIPLRTTGK